MAKVYNKLSRSLNPVRKIFSFTIQGEDHPGRISVFQSRLVSALKWIGGSVFSGAIPEAFRPRNCIQCMDSGWNLYRPFDPVSQELRQMRNVRHTVIVIKEVMEAKKRRNRRDGKFLFMIAGLEINLGY